MIKQITLSAKNSDTGTTEKVEHGIHSELRPDLGEKKSAYYAVCTNSWGDQKTAAITLCTYAVPIGDFSSYSEAKEYLDKEVNDKIKCPYCGFTHFRTSLYDDLVFDNENISTYFQID